VIFMNITFRLKCVSKMRLSDGGSYIDRGN
jgi:hypothetical protein